MIKTTGIALCTAVAGLAWIVVAGSLQPPGPPAPTMKTLEQIEPRTPIAALPFTISSPGSYYLTGNLAANYCGDHGIVIDADDVTLDLQGFTISEQFSCTFDGIHVQTDRDNITIRNGTIRGFGQDGVHADFSSSCRISGVHAIGNAGDGIEVGNRSHIDDSVAIGNAGDGIKTWVGSLVARSLATGNGGTGIWTSNYCTITGCTSYDNRVDGIRTAGGSVVSDCAASSNDQDGIDAGNSLVCGNSALSNGVANINSGTTTTLVDNHAP